MADEKKTLTLRPEVAAFAQIMEAALRRHDDRPGWKGDSPESLLRRVYEEVAELHLCVHGGARANAPFEAADVANFAMMIADVCGGLGSVAEDATPDLVEALLWCSGSADFGPGGQAHEGWQKLAVPALRKAGVLP